MNVAYGTRLCDIINRTLPVGYNGCPVYVVCSVSDTQHLSVTNHRESHITHPSIHTELCIGSVCVLYVVSCRCISLTLPTVCTILLVL